MARASFETILTTLIEKSKIQGYLIVDDIIEACVTFELDIQDTDRLSSSVLENGIILYEEKPKTNSDQEKINEYEDWAHNDYEPVFKKVIQLAPEQEYFIKYIRNIIPPQRHEMQTLQYQVLEGNKFARQRVIEMHLRLAVKFALQYAKRYKQEFSDMISLACEGLCKAIDSFKPEINGKFSGYASYWIMQNILRDIKTARPLIYYPVHFMEQYYLLRRNLHKLGIYSNEILSDKNLKKIMYFLSIDFNHAKIIAQSFIPMENIENITNTINTESQIEEWDFQNYYHLKEEQNIELSLINTYFQSSIIKVLSTIPQRESIVISLRNGLYFMRENILSELKQAIQEDNSLSTKALYENFPTWIEESTLNEIGDYLHVTRERVRQIEKKALKKLRSPKRLHGLVDYFDIDLTEEMVHKLLQL